MKKRIRVTIAIIFIAPLFLVLSLLAMLLGHLLLLLHLERASEKTVHFLLDILIAWIFLCLGVRLHVSGKENIQAWGTRVCYIANHQSMMDIPVLYGAGMWCGLVAKKELFRIPLLHGLLSILRCVAIDRSSLRASLKSIMKGVEQIESGYPMGIFPEGTRSKTGEIAEMKVDSFRIVHVYVKILKPIDTSALSEEEMKTLHSDVENAIREAYAALPGPYAKC